jgi:hypothetical protein
MVASANAPSITPERAWTFALNKVSSEPAHENLTCAMTVSASSPFGEGHDEGKDAEGLVRCHRQTHHGAGVLGDGLLFRSFKEDHRIGTIGRNRISSRK